MKKIILLSACFIFGLSNAQEAKNTQENAVKISAKLGLNVSSISGDATNVESAVSIHGGLVVEIPIDEKFSIQPELLFSIQGAKSDGVMEIEGDLYNVDERLILSYINVPVMVKYYITPKFGVHAGPQFGFLVSAKDKIEFNDGAGVAGDETVDVKDSFKTIDASFGLGLSYDFTEKIFAETRFNIGLSNISDVETVDLQNNVFQISVGYRFN